MTSKEEQEVAAQEAILVEEEAQGYETPRGESRIFKRRRKSVTIIPRDTTQDSKVVKQLDPELAFLLEGQRIDAEAAESAMIHYRRSSKNPKIRNLERMPEKEVIVEKW